MAYTARNLCTRSLKLSGAVSGIQEPSNEEINEALHELNNIVAGYAMESYWPASQNIINWTPATLKDTYLIGGNQDINTATPTIIEQVQILDGGSYYNLNRVQFLNQISKQIDIESERPSNFSYQRDSLTTGILRFDSTLDRAYEMRIIINAVIPEYALDDVITLPLAYTGCLEYSLASILAIIFGKPDQNLNAIASTRLERIMMFNIKCPPLSYDGISNDISSGSYDIYTDTFQ